MLHVFFLRAKPTLHAGPQAGVLLAACREHLSGLASWEVPTAGMFLWLTLKPRPDGAWVCIADAHTPQACCCGALLLFLFNCLTRPSGH